MAEPLRTDVLAVNPEHPEADVIARAAAVLRAAGLVAFPTETVYGLGANALDAAAVARIFAAKGRPANNPLIVHVAAVEEARRLVADWPEIADRLAARFWPGPLTLVLPRCISIPDMVTAGGPTVALRLPAHPVARALITAAGAPLAAPSANASSRLSPTRAEHVLHDLGGRVDLILDGGPTAGGLESTVLDITRTPPRLLRPGLVPPADLEAVIGPVTRRGKAAPEATALPSPGLLRRHYAPRARLHCTADDGRALAEELCRRGARVGWLTFAAAEERPGLTVVVMPRDPAAYAARLYDTLHSLDAAGVEAIVVAMPPDTDAWLAVRDRLRRAAAVE
jgi:L-threonylcarbamoyladenylate synthase